MNTRTHTAQDTLDDAVLAALHAAVDAAEATFTEASVTLSSVRREGFWHDSGACEVCIADEPCEIATPCSECRELRAACDACIEEDRVALEAYEAALDAERDAKEALDAYLWA